MCYAVPRARRRGVLALISPVPPSAQLYVFESLLGGHLSERCAKCSTVYVLVPPPASCAVCVRAIVNYGVVATPRLVLPRGVGVAGAAPLLVIATCSSQCSSLSPVINSRAFVSRLFVCHFTIEGNVVRDVCALR